MSTGSKNKMGGITEAMVYTWLCVGIVYSMLFLTYLNTILSILLVAWWLIFSKKQFDLSSRKTKLMLLFLSLYIIGIAGMIYTNNIKAGIATLKTQSAILFFPLVFGTTSIVSSAILQKITTHFLIATSIASLAGLTFGLYHYIQIESIEQLTGPHILPFHALRPVYMGWFCLLAMIIAFQKLESDSIKSRGLVYGALVLITFMIFLLSIRLVIVCWSAVALYFLIRLSKKFLFKILWITALILILVISGFSIPSVKRQWNELFDFSAKTTIILGQDSSLGRSWGGKALRMAIWKCSTDILQDHLLIGVGTGDVQDSLQHAYENRKFYFAARYNSYNAHNEYLQITLANGLPGLLILLTCIAYPLFQYRKKFTGNVYRLFLLLFIVAAISESILEVNKGIIWYSFFNSIFAFGYLKSDQL